MKNSQLAAKTPLAALAASVTLLALVGLAAGADLQLSPSTKLTITHEGPSPGTCPSSLTPSQEPCDFFHVSIPFSFNKHASDIQDDAMGQMALTFGSDCSPGHQVFEVDLPAGALEPSSSTRKASFTGVVPAKDFATLHGPVNVFVKLTLQVFPQHGNPIVAGVLTADGEGDFATLTSGSVGVAVNSTEAVADGDTDTNCVVVAAPHFNSLNF